MYNRRVFSQRRSLTASPNQSPTFCTAKAHSKTKRSRYNSPRRPITFGRNIAPTHINPGLTRQQPFVSVYVASHLVDELWAPKYVRPITKFGGTPPLRLLSPTGRDRTHPIRQISGSFRSRSSRRWICSGLTLATWQSLSSDSRPE